jgi:5-methylcytosine-specific restriction endonuclease McrA
MRRPCLTCGRPGEGSYCEAHAPQDSRRRPGYGYAWTKISAAMRKRYPFCFLCGISGVPLNVDHLVPRSMGGTDDPANLRVLCVPCHAAFGKKKNSRSRG